MRIPIAVGLLLTVCGGPESAGMASPAKPPSTVRPQADDRATGAHTFRCDDFNRNEVKCAGVIDDPGCCSESRNRTAG